jgi:hypothetical protein
LAQLAYFEFAKIGRQLDLVEQRGLGSHAGLPFCTFARLPAPAFKIDALEMAGTRYLRCFDAAEGRRP